MAGRSTQALERMRTARNAAIGALGVSIIAAAWFWPREDSVATSLEIAARSPGSSVVLSRFTDFPWEKVFFFGPYTDASVVRNALGFDWPGYRGFGLEMADSFSLAVFVTDGRVNRAVKIRRCSPDFAKQLLAKPISQSEASFGVDASNGCPTLVPAGRSKVAGMRSNNALDRTVKQSGPRLSAAWLLWPAAQLGR